MWRIALIFALFLAAEASADSLQWEAGVVDENHAAADGFRIHYGAASGSYTNTVDVGNVLTWPLPESWPAGTYYFAASAYNADGESAYSNEAVWVKSTASIQPASGGSYQLTWVEDQPMADVSRTGTNVEIDSNSQAGSQSITVPTCDLMVALATGYSNSSGNGLFGTGQVFGLGGADFAGSTKLTVAQSAYSTPIINSGQVYIAYLVSPTSGTQTFRWSLAGTTTEGMNLKILFYTNVDTADPITDSDKQLTVNGDLTGLTAGTSDMMVGAAYKYNATFTSVNDSGQTALFNDVYNSAANGCAEKVGGTGFYFTGGDYTICAAIVIKAAAAAASTTTKFGKPAAIMRGMYRGMWLDNDWLKPTGGS